MRLHASERASEVDGRWTEVTVHRKVKPLALRKCALKAWGQLALADRHYTQLCLRLAALARSAGVARIAGVGVARAAVFGSLE